jgi:hypothetical protein
MKISLSKGDVFGYQDIQYRTFTPSCRLLSVVVSALICPVSRMLSYKVAVLERHELFSTHVLVCVLVVCRNAFAIDSALLSR